MKKLSIIIATYNSSKTLKQALDSIKHQSFNNIETIIIDGLSQDSTMDIIRAYKDIVSIVVSERDSGIYNALNKGINLATGDYIYVLGSDDCLYDYDVIKNIMTKIDNETLLLSGTVKIVDEITKEERMINNRISKEEIFSGHMIPHQGMFVRSDVMKKYLFDENIKIIADYDFLVRYLIDGGEIYFVDDCVAYYSNGGKSSANVGCHEWNLMVYEHFYCLGKNKLINSHLDLYMNLLFGSGGKSKIKYHLKQLQRLVTAKFKILDFINKKLKKYKKGKTIHYCKLNLCRWCKR